MDMETNVCKWNRWCWYYLFCYYLFVKNINILYFILIYDRFWIFIVVAVEFMCCFRILLKNIVDVSSLAVICSIVVIIIRIEEVGLCLIVIVKMMMVIAFCYLFVISYYTIVY